LGHGNTSFLRQYDGKNSVRQVWGGSVSTTPSFEKRASNGVFSNGSPFGVRWCRLFAKRNAQTICYRFRLLYYLLPSEMFLPIIIIHCSHYSTVSSYNKIVSRIFDEKKTSTEPTPSFLTCCLFALVIPLSLVLLGTLFFYGFGGRLIDIYHTFEWNSHFGKTGEVLTVVIGILVLCGFWICSTLILAGVPVRYATYFILPVTLSFPIAFILTPLGHQSFWVSSIVFSAWCLCIFMLAFSLIISLKKTRAYVTRRPRKSLDSLPRAESVSRKDLQTAKKYRSGLEKFLKQCAKYGSLATFQESGEYHHKYDIYIDDYHVKDTDMMVEVDVDIAIAEYCLMKNVSKFRHNLAMTYRAQWETQNHKISPVSSEHFPKIANGIFHSLAALDIKQIAIQSEYLSTGIRNLRIPLHYYNEVVYFAIIAAVQGDMVILQRAVERLRKGQTLFYRLFDEHPGYWLHYLTGLAEKDVVLCNEGIRIYAEEHYYRVSQDVDSQYYMNIQAIGMANLCRIHGLDVAAIPPIVPEELLLKIGEEVGEQSMDIFERIFE